jgi:alkylated DNA repair protein (DNA oxidative demethylase)
MLFSAPPQQLATDVWLLSNFAPVADLMIDVQSVIDQAPLRHMQVPSGQRMAVAMTNCGALGWSSSLQGYRYVDCDPASQLPWPAMPERFRLLARDAAELVGWPHFSPDACLINHYMPGAGLGLHQDRDELDLQAPIVSVSLGASCRFILGGLQRGDTTRSFVLHSGDVMVWGGVSRLIFHGVHPLPAAGSTRYNLTFRKVR